MQFFNVPQKVIFIFYRLIEKRKSEDGHRHEKGSRKERRYRDHQDTSEDPLEGKFVYAVYQRINKIPIN